MSYEDLIKAVYGNTVNKSYDLFTEIRNKEREKVNAFIGNNIYRKLMYKVSSKYRWKVKTMVDDSDLNKDGYITFNIYKGEGIN